MVILCLGDGADLIGESQGFGEVLELEDALKALLAVHFFELPVVNLRQEAGDLRTR